MIEVKNLTKIYGVHKAIDNLNFTIETGRIYGFLGPNGAGKSTTMNIITGCLAATEGTVVVEGHDIFEEPVEAKKCIGYLPELPPLYLDMTPEEYLRFVAQAKGIDRGMIKKEVARVIEATGLSEMKQRLMKNLSKGYRQRVGIAQAILGDPSIIILDEPTVGLDPKQIIEIRELITQLGENHTVILSSHIMQEVKSVCDHIIIISQGKLVASDTPEHLSEHLEENTTLHLIVRGASEAVRAAMEDVSGDIWTEDAEAAENTENAEDIADIEDTEAAEDADDTEKGNVQVMVQEGEESGTVNLTVRIPGRLKKDGVPDIRDEVSLALSKRGLAVLEMNLEALSLEDVFLELTGEGGEKDDSHL